jgi:hypothetical protein
MYLDGLGIADLDTAMAVRPCEGCRTVGSPTAKPGHRGRISLDMGNEELGMGIFNSVLV